MTSNLHIIFIMHTYSIIHYVLLVFDLCAHLCLILLLLTTSITHSTLRLLVNIRETSALPGDHQTHHT